MILNIPLISYRIIININCSGDKGYFELNDFLELHRNMYYVQPKENITNYLTV